MRYINTSEDSITFIDVDGKQLIVPKNRVYTHFNVDTVTFLLIERYDNEGICLFSTKASDLQINGETYTYQELLDGEGISDLFSPTGLSFEIVEELPQSGEEGTIYLVPNDHDTYTEYIWIAEEEKWEAIGDSDIDLSNYYTKTQTDNTFATQTVVNQEIAARIQGDADINTALTAKADKSDTYTKTQVDTALSAKANAADVYTKTQVDTALSAKQDTLTAGIGIDITNNVISATGGTQVQSDWNQSDSSAVDYIKNKPTIPDTSDFVTKAEYNPKEVAIAQALTDLNENKADKTELPDTSTFATKTELNAKQDTLTAGQNITIQNNVISATGGGASYQYYTETDEEEQQGEVINRDKSGVVLISGNEGASNVELAAYYNEIEEEGSVTHSEPYATMNANKDDGKTVRSATISVNYDYASITVNENGEDKGTTYTKNTDFAVTPDSLTVEVNVDGVTATQLELNKRGLSINGDNVLTDNDAYTKSEIDAMIGNIQTILASI